MKLLLISHDDLLWGAPRSLAGIAQQLAAKEDWDIRILVRNGTKGETLDFSSIAPSQVWLRAHEADTLCKICPSLRMLLGALLRGRWKEYHKLLSDRTRKRCAENRMSKALAGIVKWNPDIIYANTVMNGDLLRRLDLKAPIVTHVRELQWFLKTLTVEDLNFLRTTPSHYLAVSNAVRANLIDNHDIDSELISVVPVGIDPELVDTGSVADAYLTYRAELNIPSDAFVVSVVGCIDDRKGWRLLADTAGILATSGNTTNIDSIYYVWVGDGPAREALTRAFEEFGISDRLRITGLKREPFPYMATADIHFTPSLDDPFPRVNLEAALLRKPVITFLPSGGSAEFVGDDAGIVIDEFDPIEAGRAILKLRDEPELRSRLGENGRNKVMGHFTVQTIADEVERSLKEVIERVSSSKSYR